jgi:large subunit GTPase 1
LKGFYTGRGLPNEAQASRFILKDYTNGHLIYCKLPPNYVGDNVWQSNPLESINV